MILYSDSLILPPLQVVEKEIKFKNVRKNGKNSKKIFTCQNIISFDTESTSAIKIKDEYITDLTQYNDNNDYVYSDDDIKKAQKVGWVYIWMFCIDGITIYGRTLFELSKMLDKMESTYIMPLIEKNKGKQYKAAPIIMVHNLPWDYYFIKDICCFEDVFARENNKPIKAIDYRGFEWRDTLALTNSKLANLPKLFNFEDKVEKKVGDLKYDVLRTPTTPLTDKELGYCEADVLVLYHLGCELQRLYGYMQDIPLTQTGRLRPEVYKIMNETGYDFLAQELQPRISDDFLDALTLFSGGYTHADYSQTGKVVENVHSKDICSSYPTVLITEKFPCEKFRNVKKSLDDLDYENYSYILKLKFNKIESKTYTSTLSYHKILNPDVITELSLDNGRLRYAEGDGIEIIITEQDYLIFNETYDFEGLESVYVKQAKKDYLPADFVKLILKYYKEKTMFKDDDENKVAYAIAKMFVNALYGLCVTQYITDESVYHNGKWYNIELAPLDYINDLTDTIKKDENISDYEKEKQIDYISTMYKSIEQKIEEELENIKLPFYTGVWCTAYARHNLFKTMLQIDSPEVDCDDVVYSDTDSVKFKGDHEKIFELYNNEMIKKLESVAARIGLNIDDYAPKDKKGIRHPIGVYDDEGDVILKTWGAKKYLTYDLKKKSMKLTVAGCSKSSVKYIIKKALGEEKEELTKEEALKIFDLFEPGLVFPREESGRSIIYRVDKQGENNIIDVKGEKIFAPSACVLIPCTYSLDIKEDYSDLINNICPHNKIEFIDKRRKSHLEQAVEKLGLGKDFIELLNENLKDENSEIIINETPYD